MDKNFRDNEGLRVPRLQISIGPEVPVVAAAAAVEVAVRRRSHDLGEAAVGSASSAASAATSTTLAATAVAASRLLRGHPRGAASTGPCAAAGAAEGGRIETTTYSSIPPLATRASMRGYVQCCWAWAGEGISSGTEVVPVSTVAVASPRLSETCPANAAARMHRWSLSKTSEGEAQRAAWRDWPCRCRIQTTWGVLLRVADRSTPLSPALERLQRTWQHRR